MKTMKKIELTIEALKQIRIKAMKEKDLVTRTAVEGVISAADLVRGRGVEVDSKKLVDLIKKEIVAYKELTKLGQDRTKEIDILEALLPEVVIVTNEEVEHLVALAIAVAAKTPKDFFDYMYKTIPDAEYDKAYAAKAFMKILKQTK